MIERVLEPEVMDSAQEAQDYDSMDHQAVNQSFVDNFFQVGWGGAILDVGTGTAQIPIEIGRRSTFVRITGVDLAEQMLIIGRKNVLNARLEQRIKLERVNARAMPYPDGQFDVVISNSIIHHIPIPEQVFREMVRVISPGGRLFVRDLMRPDDEATLAQLVETYAATANPNQRKLFTDSLRAALTLDEVRAIITGLGFDAETAVATSDRHWTWSATKPR